MRLSLRAGERIYINGAVLRVDRKVALELLNDATFLLEAQVMQAADANTPLRQLYFIVQLMLIAPADIREASELFRQHHRAMLLLYENVEILAGLRAIQNLVAIGRCYDALKSIRALFPVEAAVMAPAQVPAVEVIEPEKVPTQAA